MSSAVGQALLQSLPQSVDLEAAFIVFTLPNYAGSEARVQRRGRKIDFPVTHPFESSEGIGTLRWDVYLTTVSRLAESAMMTRLGETG